GVVRLRLLFLVVLVGAVFVAPARADLQFARCGATSTLECATLPAPLDPAGAVPGTVALHVERRVPPTASRGVVLLLAGGPGQASAGILDRLGDADIPLF